MADESGFGGGMGFGQFRANLNMNRNKVSSAGGSCASTAMSRRLADSRNPSRSSMTSQRTPTRTRSATRSTSSSPTSRRRRSRRTGRRGKSGVISTEIGAHLPEERERPARAGRRQTQPRHSCAGSAWTTRRVRADRGRSTSGLHSPPLPGEAGSRRCSRRWRSRTRTRASAHRARSPTSCRAASPTQRGRITSCNGSRRMRAWCG